MSNETNPFVITGKIDPEYFCDREQESSRLIKSVTNGNNIVLISPRRMGKTGLIRFCYEREEIKGHYYTFFIDILHTSSLKEFTYLLGREIFESLLPMGRKAANLFIRTLKSVSGCFGFDPLSGLPSFNLSLGDIERPDFTLEEIFNYLDAADKRCIVAIDEFQQVARYPEKNIEALLRSHIQKSGNCNFIFAGSERHMMSEMFLKSSRPFYRSADMLELGVIPKEKYILFVSGHFTSRNRRVSSEDIGRVYDLFNGHTFYVQKVFNEAFSDTPTGQACTNEVLDNAISILVNANDVIYREMLSNIPLRQKELLYAIAHEGEVVGLMSASFIKKHKLSSASSVQSALRVLIESDIITKSEKSYRVSDRFFALWLKKIC